MPKDRWDERTCNLTVVLSSFGGLNISFRRKSGAERRFVLYGKVDDSPWLWAPHFRNKPARIEISSPPDAGWLAEVLGEPDAKGACGLVEVDANVEPKRHEHEGEIVDEEPVRVRLKVNTDLFDALCVQGNEAYKQRRIIWAVLTLFGKSLPETGSRFITLADFDVSAYTVYAVGDFEIFDTRYTDQLRGRVLPVERNPDVERPANLSIQLKEAAYEVNVERGVIHQVSCRGRIVSKRGESYEGAEVTIQFLEHEPNSATGRLPERAAFGEFSYWPRTLNDEGSSPHFSFELKYIPEDGSALFAPLLTQDSRREVTLNVSLTTDKEELLTATRELKGDVRHYDFGVRQKLSDA